MRKRVLIVDDEPAFTRLMGMNLEDTGDYEIKIENNPEKATQTAHYFRPDVIVLDILMPGKSGLQLAEEWLAHPELKSVPVIFLTAAMSKDQPSIENPLFEQHEVLIKPVGFTELTQAINRARPPASAA